MKTIKFTPELSEQIIAGTKTSTWRLFDDKDLTVGGQNKLCKQGNIRKFRNRGDNSFIYKDSWYS